MSSSNFGLGGSANAGPRASGWGTLLVAGLVLSTDEWRGEINLQLQLKKESEQQALAKYKRGYVTDHDLAAKQGSLPLSYPL